MGVRILLVDDQTLVRTGLRAMLEPEPDFEIVGEAPDGLAALEISARLRPDVILMDVRMPRLDGIEATRRLTTQPNSPRVIILTTFDLDEYVFSALAAGASGFLLKDAEPDQITAAIRVVASGEALLAPAVTRRLIAEFVRGRPRREVPELAELTTREREVLGLIARGLSNPEIGAALAVESSTVKTHVARVLMKLGLRDRVQAVVLAFETGLVSPGGLVD